MDSPLDSTSIRLLIRQKLADGRLPHNSIPRVWRGAGADEMCDACEVIITPTEFIMEGVTMSGEPPQGNGFKLIRTLIP